MELLYKFAIFAKLFQEVFQEENEKLFSDYKEREMLLNEFMNIFMKNRTNTLWNENGEFKIHPSIFIQKFLEMLKEYLNYSGLDYFSIPVIGKISSGKSTFLNSLLGLDCLESRTDITTKFICIIRHNPDNVIPRLYPAKLVERKSEIHKKAFNFVKDEKNEIIGDLKENIKNINEEIGNCKELYTFSDNNFQKFFYILEANLDIFKGKNYIFSKIFEFLDLPGLNEITDFYLNNIIPKITPNTHFSLFIFDAGNSEDEQTRELFKKFLKLMNSKAKKNSFFIYNKLDKFKNGKLKENEQLLYFKNDILFKTYKLKLKNNHFVGLNSIQLNYDKKKNDKFDFYIKGIIENIPKVKSKRQKPPNFRNIFMEKIMEDFKIEELEEIDEDEMNNNKTQDDDNLLIEVNSQLQKKGLEKIDIDFIINMKIVYNKYNNSKINENNKKGNEKEKYEELYELFYKSFNDTVIDFVGKGNLKLLIKTFNTLLIRIYELSKSIEEKQKVKEIILHLSKHYGKFLYPNIGYNEKYFFSEDILEFRFYNFEFEIENIINWNRGIISSLLDDLNLLKDFKSNLISRTIFNVQNVLNYIDERKIRLTLLGKYFSDKIGILNCFIKKEIIPSLEMNKDSNINIIIHHNNEENTVLYKAKINFIENYFYFEKENEVIASGDENIRNKLIELKSSGTTFDNSFYILKVPLKALQVIQFNTRILDKIEIVCLSGKYIGNLEFKKNIEFENLIKYSDSFIYVENEKNISKESFIFLKKIIFFISTINNSFNLEKFLLVINKMSKGNNIPEKIIESMKANLPKMKVSWFSINEYYEFLKIINIIQDNKTFFAKMIDKNKSKNIENILNEIEKEIDLLSNIKIKNYSYYIKKLRFKLDFFYFFVAPELSKINDNLIGSLKLKGYSDYEINKYLDKINKISRKLSFLKEHIYNLSSYVESNEEIFFSEIYELIFNIKYYFDYNLKLITENVKDYLKSIFELIYDKALYYNNEDPKYIFSFGDEENKLIKDFENYFKDYKKYFLDEIEKYKNEYITKINSIYNNKLGRKENIDELMETEEKLFLQQLLNNLSTYSISFSQFKEKYKLNDIFINSKIYLNDYDRSIINKDSIKTEFKFGWFFYYSIKNKINNRFLLPESINYSFDNENLKKEDNLKYYEFKYNGFKYFIDNILVDIYSEMKNNIIHIIEFKEESFDEIKKHLENFVERYISMFDLFDENDIVEEGYKN